MTEKLTEITTMEVVNWRPKPWPDSLALAFSYLRPGQSRDQAMTLAWLGPAYLGLAWLGFWPEAGPCTSLDGGQIPWPQSSSSKFPINILHFGQSIFQCNARRLEPSYTLYLIFLCIILRLCLYGRTWAAQPVSQLPFACNLGLIIITELVSEVGMHVWGLATSWWLKGRQSRR